MRDEHAITYSLIRDTDSRLASQIEKPEEDGFQALGFEQQEAVLNWIENHCEQVENSGKNVTSRRAARACCDDLKESFGRKTHVSNLAMKTALALCGFEPTVPAPVEIQYYRINLSRKPIDRREEV